jgi:hypothetical protein
MDEQSTRAQEAVRAAQEAAARRSQAGPAATPSQPQSGAAATPSQPAREAAKEATRAAGQLAGLGTETLTVWTGATQHALRDVLELSTQATQEGARQLIGWQQMNLELVREVQGAAFRWYTLWPEFLRDPIRGYQRSLEESIEAEHRVFEITRRNAEAVAESYQRLERAADTATRTLGDTFKEAATRMQDAYARSDRPRAA